jgi:hypothetical protein
MIVTTHFETINGKPINEKQRKLLELWKNSWELRGFTCIITDETIYSNVTDIFFTNFIKKIESFPSVNTQGFDRAGFVRWYAAYLVAVKYNEPICISECDVINYSLFPTDLENLSPDKFNIGDRDVCPAFVYTSHLILHDLLLKITC